MPLITPSTDSLPYIDRPPSPTSLTRASSLIASASPPSSRNHPHPSLPPPPSSHLTPLFESELLYLATHPHLSSQPSTTNTPNQKPSLFTSTDPARTGIDSTRYSSLPELPPPTAPLEDRIKVLKQAYTQATYLRHRTQSLSLLEAYGKNAWLIGNDELEGMLRDVEKELVGLRGEVEGVNRERKSGQEGRRGDLEGLEAAWREGVGRGVEVGVAVRGVEGRRGEEGVRGR